MDGHTAIHPGHSTDTNFGLYSVRCVICIGRPTPTGKNAHLKGEEATQRSWHSIIWRRRKRNGAMHARTRGNPCARLVSSERAADHRRHRNLYSVGSEMPWPRMPWMVSNETLGSTRMMSEGGAVQRSWRGQEGKERKVGERSWPRWVM